MSTAPNAPSLTRIHWLLTIQSVIIVLLSINRLSSLTTGYVASNQFLRWVDLNNMLILPLVSMVAFYVLFRHLERPATPAVARWDMALSVTLIAGIYLLAAGYGDHEVTNYLHIRFCLDDPSSDLCRIIIFNDDEFSHWVFFAGYILVNAAVLLKQVLFPWPGAVAGRDLIFLTLNGLVIGLGIFANLAFEEIGLDLYVIALLAALALWLLWRGGRQPIFVYYATAFTFGLVATAIVKLSSAF